MSNRPAEHLLDHLTHVIGRIMRYIVINTCLRGINCVISYERTIHYRCSSAHVQQEDCLVYTVVVIGIVPFALISIRVCVRT